VKPNDPSNADLQGIAQAIMALGIAGNEIGDVITRHTDSEAMISNSAMMAAAILWLNGSMRPSEIARALSVTTGGATKIVNRLERDGIVRKQREGRDGRAVLVDLTDDGAAMLEGILGDLDGILREFLARLGVGILST
jgi:DNA-binding MarR family transcriptional regulator